MEVSFHDITLPDLDVSMNVEVPGKEAYPMSQTSTPKNRAINVGSVTTAR